MYKEGRLLFLETDQSYVVMQLISLLDYQINWAIQSIIVLDNKINYKKNLNTVIFTVIVIIIRFDYFS